MNGFRTKSLTSHHWGNRLARYHMGLAALITNPQRIAEEAAEAERERIPNQLASDGGFERATNG